jgi:uncharacterized protein DUF1707
VAAGYEIRVSDAEREAAAAELREHFASGRLDQEELDERLARVFAAKTRGDLNAVFTDLPSSGTAWSGATDAGRPFAGHGQFGPGSWSGPGQDRSDSSWHRAPGARAGGALAAFFFLVPVLMVLGILGAFGIGTGRPLGIVLIFAAFALLRRLLLVIFGRRRIGGRGPRRGRRC